MFIPVDRNIYPLSVPAKFSSIQAIRTACSLAKMDDLNVDSYFIGRGFFLFLYFINIFQNAIK